MKTPIPSCFGGLWCGNCHVSPVGCLKHPVFDSAMAVWWMRAGEQDAEEARYVGCVKAALIDLQCWIFGLSYLFDDLLITGAQLVIPVSLLFQDGTDPIVLAGAGCYVTEDA